MIFSVCVFVRSKTYGANAVYFHLKPTVFLTLPLKFGNFESHSCERTEKCFSPHNLYQSTELLPWYSRICL